MEKITSFKSSDGKLFGTKKECLDHEQKSKNVKAFRVGYQVDRTETGCLKKHGFVLVHANRNHEDFCEHFCFVRFGNKVSFVQGVYGSNAICPAWNVQEVSIDKVDNKLILGKLQEKFVDRLWDDNDENVITTNKFS